MSFGRKIESRSNNRHPIGPQERIAYHGDIRPLLHSIPNLYGFGEYITHEVKKNGYEDFNIILQTSSGSSTNEPFFVKCFADWRSQKDCERYLDMIQHADDAGVRTPTLLKNTEGNVLTTIDIEGVAISLCVMEYLDRGNIFESNQPPSRLEQTEIIRQAAIINKCKFIPKEIEDSWAIPHMKKKYEAIVDRVDPRDKPIISDLLDQLEVLDLSTLPHTFVHNDIRSTNVMRHSDGQIYIIDFSVANWYPRVMEFAVLCCDILFDPNNPNLFNDTYNWAIEEYRKAGVIFTPIELQTLPLFVRLAHAMNVLGAGSQDATNYISQKENDHWLEIGRQGLHFTANHWNP